MKSIIPFPVNTIGCADRCYISSCDFFNGEVLLTAEKVIDDWQNSREN